MDEEYQEDGQDQESFYDSLDPLTKTAVVINSVH